jgi:hypothetical protein
MPEPSEMDGFGRPRGEYLVRDLRDFSRLTGPPGGVRRPREDLVGDIVVRGAEQFDEDLRKGARLAVDIDRPQARVDPKSRP